MTEKDDAPPDNVVRVAFGAAKPMRADACPRAEEKLAFFSRLIESGMVLVNLDTRVPGAVVPSQFAGDVQLGLNFSHRFGLSDFEYDTRGVRASLSFQGQPVFCDVPWSAVFMIRSYVTEDVSLFSESMPRELAKLLQDAETVPEDESESQKTSGDESLPADEATSADEMSAEYGNESEGSTEELPSDKDVAPDDDEPSPPPDGKGRPGLRLVKS